MDEAGRVRTNVHSTVRACIKNNPPIKVNLSEMVFLTLPSQEHAGFVGRSSRLLLGTIYFPRLEDIFIDYKYGGT